MQSLAYIQDFLKGLNLTTENAAMILCTGVVGGAGVYIILYLLKNRKIYKRIEEKQQRCRQSIKQLEENVGKSKLTDRQRDKILGMKFTDLQKSLQTDQLMAEEVLKAYQSKASEVNKDLNFMVEPVNEAMQTAKACDQTKRAKKRPLHGIPISIKENFYLKGYDSTGGMSEYIGKPAIDDGILIKVLKHQGAVPFIRTNIPQSMMTYECSNPIYGVTVNPHNKKRGPGGSSGGEGAVLAAEGSILGWGNDIGGSLRIPSNSCGIYCLKPTTGRLSLKSCEELVVGQTLIVPTDGPMGRDVDTLVEAMRAVLCEYHFELDPDVPPIPFRNQIYESTHPLKIGYYIDDGNVKAIPGVERAVQEAKRALEKMGHTLVPFSVPRSTYMFSELFCSIVFGDGGVNFLSKWANDAIDPSIQLIVWTYKLPSFVQLFIGFLMNIFSGEKLPGQMMKSMQGVKSVKDWWSLAGKLHDYRAEFLATWKENELDAILCPTMPYVAVPTGCVKYLLGGVTYTTLYNLLNYPSGCVPVTKVTAVDQAKMKDYPTDTTSHQFIKKYYSSDTGGLPVAVQCVGLPYQEELVLRVMKELEIGLKRFN